MSSMSDAIGSAEWVDLEPMGLLKSSVGMRFKLIDISNIVLGEVSYRAGLMKVQTDLLIFSVERESVSNSEVRDVLIKCFNKFGYQQHSPSRMTEIGYFSADVHNDDIAVILDHYLKEKRVQDCS